MLPPTPFSVSVVIPCHNAARWIGAALASVAAQELPAREVLVVDDGSTDDSVAAVKASGVPVRLLHTNARNAAAARNVGIGAATGDWIALLDADDVWYPNHLQRAGELLSRGNDVAYMANHHWINLAGRVVPMPPSFRVPFDEARTGLPHGQYIDLFASMHFGHSTVIYRADRLREVGGFDASQRRRHDIDLWLRVVRDHTWAYDPQPQAGYREDTPGSISKQVTSCEYFFLRSLLRNQPAYESPAMSGLIAVSARRGMGLAFVDDPDEFPAMKSLAWEHLRPSYRAFYRVASLWPHPFRWAIRFKRRLFNRVPSERTTT